MKKFFKQGRHVLLVIICVMLMCPAESAVAADNLFTQMEADGVYQQYADLMDVSVQYQDEKKLVWELIHTAVDLQRQVLEGGMETPMPEDMVQYMNDAHLDYDVTGEEMLPSAAQWDMVIHSLYSRLNVLQSELDMVLTEANGIASQYNAGNYAGGMPQVNAGGLLSGGGIGKLIVGVLIGILIGSAGATAAGRGKKRM